MWNDQLEQKRSSGYLLDGPGRQSEAAPEGMKEPQDFLTHSVLRASRDFNNRPDNNKSPELLLLKKLRKVHDGTVDCRKHLSQKLKRKLTSTEH